MSVLVRRVTTPLWGSTSSTYPVERSTKRSAVDVLCPSEALREGGLIPRNPSPAVGVLLTCNKRGGVIVPSPSAFPASVARLERMLSYVLPMAEPQEGASCPAPRPASVSLRVSPFELRKKYHHARPIAIRMASAMSV